jgi:hypothetical protein
MDLERRTEEDSSKLGRVEVDAVVKIRRALALAESGQPLYPGEGREAAAAIAEVEARLARLRARGIEFAKVDLSSYVRQLVPARGRMTLAS